MRKHRLERNRVIFEDTYFIWLIGRVLAVREPKAGVCVNDIGSLKNCPEENVIWKKASSRTIVHQTLPVSVMVTNGSIISDELLSGRWKGRLGAVLRGPKPVEGKRG